MSGAKETVQHVGKDIKAEGEISQNRVKDRLSKRFPEYLRNINNHDPLTPVWQVVISQGGVSGIVYCTHTRYNERNGRYQGSILEPNGNLRPLIYEPGKGKEKGKIKIGKPLEGKEYFQAVDEGIREQAEYVKKKIKELRRKGRKEKKKTVKEEGNSENSD